MLKKPSWVPGKAHVVSRAAISLLPIAPGAEKALQTRELGRESPEVPLWSMVPLQWEGVIQEHTPLEQVPQKKPRPVHFHCMYVGHFGGREEGRLLIWRTAYIPLSPRWAQVGIGAAQSCPCWVISFYCHADEVMASASEAQEGT